MLIASSRGTLISENCNSVESRYVNVDSADMQIKCKHLLRNIYLIFAIYCVPLPGKGFGMFSKSCHILSKQIKKWRFFCYPAQEL
jgi:hypothetical protein